MGWGPFVESPVRLQDRAAFYIPDYFRDNPNPWKHPDFVEEITFLELLRRLWGDSGQPAAPQIEWQAPSHKSYTTLFDSAQTEIEAGRFHKIVPVIFERGHIHSHLSDFLRHSLHSIEAGRSGLRRYGYVRGDRGFLGLSPELLFSRGVRGDVETVALAGTRPLDRAEELLTDPKEQREHGLVVLDIGERLKSWGRVEVGVTQLARFPRIAHLRTEIRLTPEAHSKDDFLRLVESLHPTAALGAWPRNVWGWNWLKWADRETDRQGFGGPFGFEKPSGEALCVVAIRQIRWNQAELLIGSGSGILRESEIESEWQELKNKRRQVKGLFGLVGEAN